MWKWPAAASRGAQRKAPVAAPDGVTGAEVSDKDGRVSAALFSALWRLFGARGRLPVFSSYVCQRSQSLFRSVISFNHIITNVWTPARWYKFAHICTYWLAAGRVAKNESNVCVTNTRLYRGSAVYSHDRQNTWWTAFFLCLITAHYTPLLTATQRRWLLSFSTNKIPPHL